MIRRWKLFLKILVFLLVVLGLYRLGEKIMRQEVLFHLERLVWTVSLLGWTLWMGVGVFKEKSGKVLNRGVSDLKEAKALIGVSVLIPAAFLITAHGRYIAGKSGGAMIPWLENAGELAHAILAGCFLAALIWALHLLLRKAVPTRDPYLFPLACMLFGFGLVLLFRLAPDIAKVRGISGFQHIFWFQLRSLGISLLVFLFSIYFFTHRRLESLTRKRYVYVLISVVLITITALWGVEIHGRRLSLNLGIMNFQTVELVKVLALLFMVGYFRYEMGVVESGKGALGLPRFRYLGPYLTMWMLTLLPIFLQKDLGPTAFIFALFMVVFYLGTGSASSAALGLVLIVGLGFLTYYAGFPSMVKTRVDMWLDPFVYSQNMAEVMWALAAGGVIGVGLGMGFSHYIPVVQSDFNFAVVAEEWGLAGVLCIIGCFVLLVWRTLDLGRRAEFGYQTLLIAGLGSLWVLQTFIIIGGNLGLLPLTGITLPFISFGGSSLLINFIMLGIVMRFSVQG